MTYEQFLNRNDRARDNRNAYSVTIDRVSYRRNLCFFANGNVSSIDNIVQFVMNGQFYLSNPSKLSKWQGFTGNKHKFNFDNPNRYWTDFN